MNTRTSRWVAATVALCVLLLVAAWFLLVSPRQARASELSDQTVAAEQGNQSLQIEIARLKEQANELPNRQADLKALQEQMPQTPDLPKLVRDLDVMATLSGVQIREIVRGTPASLPLTGVETATATRAAPAGSGAQGAAPAPAAAAPTTVTGPLVGIPVKVVVAGDYFEAAVFIRKLQSEMRRAFLVNTIDVSPDDKAGGSEQGSASAESAGSSGDVALTLDGLIFVFRPETTGAAGGVSGASAGTGQLTTGGVTGPKDAASSAAATASSRTDGIADVSQKSGTGETADPGGTQ
ncbi:MAG: hypothetical protein GXX79_05965 [Actinomycetales bacterium]|nr:hypothetical protein [Actinomycetales bacterium]